jgi:hypothetical protein
MRNMVIAALSLAFGAIQAPLWAGVLDGDTVHLQYIWPGPGSVYQDMGTLTAPGTFTNVQDRFDLVVNDSSIVVPGFYGCPDGCDSGWFWTYADFNGWVLTDDSGSPITSVTVDPATTMPGFTSDNLSWTGNQIIVNWQGLYMQGSLTLDLNGGGGRVPEPSTWLLLGTSLAGLCAWRRRRT